MGWMNNREGLEKDARAFDRSIRLVKKDCWFMRVIARILSLITFGKFQSTLFLNNYATTLGNYIFIPEGWTEKSVQNLLPHEGQHARQFRMLGFGIHPLAGLPLGALVYLLFPLPFLMAWGRFAMELKADEAKWKYLLNLGMYFPVAVEWNADHRARIVAGPTYFWTLPKSLSLYFYRKTAQKVIAEYQNRKK